MGLDIRPEDLKEKVIEVEAEAEEDSFLSQLEAHWNQGNRLLGEAETTLERFENLRRYPRVKAFFEKHLGKEMGESMGRQVARSQLVDFVGRLKQEVGDVPIAQALDTLLQRYGNLTLGQLERFLGK